MAERKPFAVPVESWVDAQIARAKKRGDFDGLPGAGKPLPKRDTSDPAWWVKQKLAEENLELPLPPGLQLRKDVRAKLAAISTLADECQVREALHLLNAHIRTTNARVISGPASDIAPLDVDSWVERWRSRRTTGT